MARSGGPPGAVLGLDIGPIGLGPTPLAMLLVLLALGAIGLVVLVALSQAGGRLVDERWPADEPLSPSEVLWGEAGGHVSKNFPGLDPDVARDLTVYMTSRKLKPGDALVEAGDLPTSFIMLKSGAAERADATGVTTKLVPGDSFGGDNIIRRQAHTATVRATEPSEVMVLDAEDYLAGVALGMREQDDDDYVVRTLGQYLTDNAHAPPVAVAAASVAPAPPTVRASGPPTDTLRAPGASTPQPGPLVHGPVWLASTHHITHKVQGFTLPAGNTPSRTLVPGTPVQMFELLPGWARVGTADGWNGWIDDHAVAEKSGS